VDQFLDLASRSGLLDAPHLHAYLQRLRQAGALPAGPGALAEVMVREGLLTRYQADQLLNGKWRNFILSGKYKVLGPLGSGGMGQVYLCEHQVMRRRVAVKVLHLYPDDPSALARFHREARAVAQLNHPNIVGGHDIDRDGKVHFLVMEYIDGSTFHHIVKQHGPMSPLRAAHYIRQAALGLQHAHQAGLVHRDVKPSNLLLDRAGTVKILDMGLARFFHDESDDLSKRQFDSPLGTTDYMAPEQAIDSHQVDVRADIYSLGGTFYCLLAGHGPFRGRSPLQKLICHRFERPRPIRELRPEVAEGLAAIIDRMMAKEPAERYQTPAEVADALVPWTRAAIPPPPPEEMPELLPPGRGTLGAGAAPGLPASLYKPARGPAPDPASPSGAPPPTVPLPPGGETPTTPVARVTPGRAKAAGRAGPRDKSAASPPPPPPRGRRTLLAAAAILLLGAGAAALAIYKLNFKKEQTVGAGADDAARLKLLVPAYLYPAGKGLAQWDRIIESPAAAATVAIVNPDNGPGKVVDPNYAKILKRARRKGVTVIGYVSTKYATRPLHEVTGNVDQWLRFYPGIQGIFFDEQASSADLVHYYAALYEYARKDKGLSLVVTNPGTTCAEEYLTRPTSDVVCLVEAAKDFTAYRRPGWADRYPADRFAALLCKVRSPAQMKTILREMHDKRIGYCFITDGQMPNPWGRLPSYWDAEAEAVQQANCQKDEG
jgi:serine/threonine protein kinase